MNIRLIGHSYKYAVEQIMLSIFPDERPVYTDTDMPGSYVRSSLAFNNGAAVSHTEISRGDRSGSATEELPSPLPADKLLLDRGLQKIIKLSFYKAAMRIVDKSPPWGALTGIRPAKLSTAYIRETSAGLEEAALYLQREYFVDPERSRLCADASEAALRVNEMLKPGDVSLYIGIPFCPSRCSYCSFVSQSVDKSMKLIEPYLDALFYEIDETGRIMADLKMRAVSLYIGGGTPTTLSALQLGMLLEKITRSFDLGSLREFSVEAGRPDTIDPEKLKTLKSFGVNRISINPQSMNDSVLAAIGRRHSGEDIINRFYLARETGFDIINMDLIAGLPSDTFDGFKMSLDKVIGLSPENITVHTLSIKRGSTLKENRAPAPGGEEVGRMLDAALFLLRSSGFKPYYLYRQKYMAGGYENTGWSKYGTDCIYNICIMEELHSILSLGAGGVTKLVNQTSGRIERIFNKKYPLEYIKDIKKITADKNGIAAFAKDSY
jgi:oxygen-independent coproporphyrinogen-3 oxidase